MASPFEILAADGSPIITGLTKCARQFGEVTTGTADGAISIPELASGSPWIATLTLGAANSLSAPQIFLNGTVISWTFSAAPGARASAKILYGVK